MLSYEDLIFNRIFEKFSTLLKGVAHKKFPQGFEFDNFLDMFYCFIDILLPSCKISFLMQFIDHRVGVFMRQGENFSACLTVK